VDNAAGPPLSGSHAAAAATDGDTTSYWMTAYAGANRPAHPHTFTIDTGSPPIITSLSYLPRQDCTGDMAEAMHSLNTLFSMVVKSTDEQHEVQSDVHVWRTQIMAARADCVHPHCSTLMLDCTRRRIEISVEISVSALKSAFHESPIGYRWPAARCLTP